MAHTALSVSVDDVRHAARLLDGVIERTPIAHSRALSRVLGSEVYLKCENLQRAGSFKARGAYVRMSQLSEDEKRRGVVAASAGNHAQGVALAAATLGITARIYMPRGAALPKIAATQDHGAEVVLACRNVDSARAAADKMSGAVSVEELDLASQRSVEEFAGRFEGPLDLLVNNAGVMTPPQYREFRETIKASDGILFVTPENNRTIPACLKNAVDIGSKPNSDVAWKGLPAGIISHSVGRMGGYSSQKNLRLALSYFDMPTLGQPEVFLGRSPELIDEQGQIVEDSTREFLQDYIDRFVALVAKTSAE